MEYLMSEKHPVVKSKLIKIKKIIEEIGKNTKYQQ